MRMIKEAHQATTASPRSTMEYRMFNYSISQEVVVVSGKPHLTVGCYGGESTRCQPWCPKLTLCSTPLLSDPGLNG